MAAQQHSISRRDVIGALAAAPVFATAGVEEAAATGGASIVRSEWELALTTYRRLQAEWAAHPYGRTAPGSPDYERLEAEEGVIADRASQALRVVLRTAVPDHAALIEKMEVFEREFGDDLDGHFADLVADARRLSGWNRPCLDGIVTPATAGAQPFTLSAALAWIPAFAGMTGRSSLNRAGTSRRQSAARRCSWVPACAGMTLGGRW